MQVSRGLVTAFLVLLEHWCCVNKPGLAHWRMTDHMEQRGDVLPRLRDLTALAEQPNDFRDQQSQLRPDDLDSPPNWEK